MGLSTFIEINNDFASEIENNPEEFVQALIRYLNSGEYKKPIVGITHIMTIHRDYERYKTMNQLIRKGCY